MLVVNNLLDYTPNVYHNYFAETENTIGFSSIRPNPLSKDFFSQRNVLSGNNKKSNIFVNAIRISGKGSVTKMASNSIDEIYGQELNFSIGHSKGGVFKNGAASKEVRMYVPRKLRLKNPRIRSEKDLLPICYYQDFVLEWNADRKNKEGLVVIAEYIGMSAVPANDKNVNILNTDIIEVDNGRVVLDNDLWQGIPDTGIVHLTLLRGNVKIEEIEGEQFKFYAETHATLSIILLKDLDTLE